MKSTGIVRGIDSLGRIVLPKELRTTLHLDGDTKLEIFVDGDAIVLKKHRPAGRCDFCGEETTVSFAVDLTITVGRIVSLLVVYGIRMLKQFLSLKKAVATNE